MTIKDLVKKIIKLKDQAKTVAIVGHHNPDGDSIGSCIAFADYLKREGKDVSLFADGDISAKFSYMPMVTEFNTKEEKDSYDLLIILDLSEIKRLGNFEHLCDKAKKILVVDHHINPDIRCDVLVSKTDRASTGEILFELFEAMDVELNRDMAEALYTSIACDTGCFLFNNTKPYTHSVAEKLMLHNIDIETINFKNFREYNRADIPVIGYVLKKMEFMFGGKMAVSYLPYNKVKQWKLTHESRHGLFKYTTDGNGVICSIFLTELKKGEFNVSLRSLGDIDVSKIARVIDGGGHKNASGASFKGKKRHLLKILLAEFSKVL